MANIFEHMQSLRAPRPDDSESTARLAQRLSAEARVMLAIPAPEAAIASAGEQLATWARGDLLQSAADGLRLLARIQAAHNDKMWMSEKEFSDYADACVEQRVLAERKAQALEAELRAELAGLGEVVAKLTREHSDLRWALRQISIAADIPATPALLRESITYGANLARSLDPIQAKDPVQIGPPVEAERRESVLVPNERGGTVEIPIYEDAAAMAAAEFSATARAEAAYAEMCASREAEAQADALVAPPAPRVAQEWETSTTVVQSPSTEDLVKASNPSLEDDSILPF